MNDGTFRGERYFFCPPKRALFVKLSSCQPDSRFQSLSSKHSERTPKEEGQNHHFWALGCFTLPTCSTTCFQALVSKGLSDSLCQTQVSACVHQQGAVPHHNVTDSTFFCQCVCLCVSVEWHTEGWLETVPPVTTEQVDHILIGRMKGIQGHCNSCYMDAALFRSGGFSLDSHSNSKSFQTAIQVVKWIPLFRIQILE